MLRLPWNAELHLPWELFYADDLVVIGETENEWKEG